MTTMTAERVIDLSPMTRTNLKEQLQVPECFTILEAGADPAAEHNVFRILNPKSGDDRLTWDRRDFAAIQEARHTFVDLVKKGFKPFRVGQDGRRSNTIMQEFDPTAQQVIFVPMQPVVGG